MKTCGFTKIKSWNHFFPKREFALQFLFDKVEI